MQHSLHRALRPRFGKAVVGWGLIALSHLTVREGVFHCLIGSPTRVKICSFPLTGPPHGGAAQHGLVLRSGFVPRDVSGIHHCQQPAPSAAIIEFHRLYPYLWKPNNRVESQCVFSCTNLLDLTSGLFGGKNWPLRFSFSFLGKTTKRHKI